MRTLYFSDISFIPSTRSGILDLGTTMSSFILLGLALKREADMARLAFQRSFTSFLSLAVLKSIAPLSRQTPATASASFLTASLFPSTSIRSSAPALGRPTLAYSSTHFIETLSTISRVDGTTFALMIAAVAFAASLRSLKSASMVTVSSGSGRSLNVAFVMTPSVPSEPTMSLVRS